MSRRSTTRSPRSATPWQCSRSARSSSITPPLVPQTIHQYNLPSHTPVSPDPADYDPNTQLVTLHDPGAPGGIVQINYCPVAPPCNDLDDFCLEDDGPDPCPAPDQYAKTFVTGGAEFTWRGGTSCTACSHHFGIAPRFGRSSYRFTYQRFHSGDSGPAKLKVCNFEVIAP